ncbi:MAG: lipid A phosphoethanolamine transferase [Deltaproteobacteria bacterium]|nr:lipid A phosphoethanolamine transferase [Deltaproteobacteria bacterium]
MLKLAVRWKRKVPLAIVTVVYTFYFHFGELERFCLATHTQAPEAMLVVPPLALEPGAGWMGLGAALVICGVYGYALLCACTVFPGAMVILLPLLFGVTAFASFFVDATGVPITSELMEAVFETNTNEAAGVLNLHLILSIAAALATCTILLLIVRSDLHADTTSRATTSRLNSRWMRALGGAALTVYAIATPISGTLALYPHNLIRGTVTYVRNKLEMDERIAHRRDVGNEGAGWQNEPPADFAVVVVLGESARADHFSINGYGRPTTPALAATRNLVSFANVTSCATMTRASVPCLMTRATASTMSVSLDETSFISIFNRLGFTSAWLSANGVYGDHDSAVSAIAKEASVREFRCSNPRADGVVLDGDLVPALDRFLDNHSGRLLAVLHTEGSHWPYDARYPSSFARFTPAFDHSTFVSWDHEPLINAYDNSVLYTDAVLAQIIERLRHRYALMLYVADHGEMLGEDGRYMHGQECPEVRHVPMLWWASDSFLDAHPQRFARLKNRRYEAVSHDYVFHSLLDCAGIKSPAIDPNLSLCRNPRSPSAVLASSAATTSSGIELIADVTSSD